MGLTVADFMRTLPSAVAAHPVESTAAGLRLSYSDAEGERELHIELLPQPDRCIASIRLPVTRVNLNFHHFNPAQIERFLQRFDLYFQKGGG